MENVNYCKQLIALGEECSVYLFNFSFGMIRIFKLKKNEQRNDKGEKENGKREIGNNQVLQVFL